MDKEIDNIKDEIYDLEDKKDKLEEKHQNIWQQIIENCTHKEIFRRYDNNKLKSLI